MNEYEAHLSSYDHTHKQRLKDMKAMVKDPGAGARARKAEAKADGIVSIKIPGVEGAAGAGGGPVSSGFKKGGFKKSGFKSAFGAAASEREVEPKPESKARLGGEERSAGMGTQARASHESDSEDDDYERYDPRCPTD